MTSILSLVSALARRLHIVVTLVALPAIAIIVGIDVTLRYVFNAPLTWSFEANELLLIVVTFGALPYVWARNRHIRMEIVYRSMHGIGRRIADFVSAIAGGVFAALLSYRMAAQIGTMIRDNESGEYLDVPYWPFSAFISLIGAIMTLQFLLRAVEAVFGAESGDPGHAGMEDE
ncbi:MAG: TRAP transporter small permease [Alphaproteobacteria bacterium]